jgi:hypothetical protein
MAQVVLRTPFSLINSEYNDFLYAPIGDEGNGMTLSVISALTRLNIDPWLEAARLSVLSKEDASQALAPIIARLPGGQWALADAPEIAGRLAALLPRHDGASPAKVAAAIGPGRANYPTLFLLLYFVCSMAASYVMATQHPSPPTSGSAATDISGADSRP